MSETSLPFNETYYPSNEKVSSGAKLKQEWQRSISNREEFWLEKAKAIDWFTPPTKALDDSNLPFYKWFPDGTLNISYNALDRHVKTAKKNKLAYIWEGEMGEVRTFSYDQLYREVNKLAKAFKNLGINKGDRIAFYLPVIPELLQPTDPLFILYTSGTTGKPKGVLHGTGGYLVWAYWTLKWAFNPTDEDIYWCTADIGWITGHTYNVYSPLSLGVTAFLFEGTPDFPAQDRWWDIIERHGITILYGTPTAVRMFMKFGEEWVLKHDLSSLRILGTVGEPINPEAWKWYYRVVGKEKLAIIDTWWQTETGGFMISPLSGIELVPLKPGSATKPLPSVQAEVYDEKGQQTTAGTKGFLVIKSPWPGMLQTLWKDPERFKQTYFGRWANTYYTGDYAVRDPEGYFWLLGRADEVLKVAGHRIGTVELESALVSHPAVSEAAVMGKEDAVKGEVPVAFVTLRTGFTPSEELRAELVKHIRTTIGPIATPDAIIIVNKLPKTRSGKIMRRLLKAVLVGAPLGDTSTLEDEASLEDIKTTYEEMRKQLAK